MEQLWSQILNDFCLNIHPIHPTPLGNQRRVPLGFSRKDILVQPRRCLEQRLVGENEHRWHIRSILTIPPRSRRKLKKNVCLVSLSYPSSAAQQVDNIQNMSMRVTSGDVAVRTALWQVRFHSANHDLFSVSPNSVRHCWQWTAENQPITLSNPAILHC